MCEDEIIEVITSFVLGIWGVTPWGGKNTAPHGAVSVGVHGQQEWILSESADFHELQQFRRDGILGYIAVYTG
jgi:hypothetical protein